MPAYDANGNLTSGDPNCALHDRRRIRTYMWNGMTGLFVKIEQNNLWNEINFNLYTTDPDNATAIRRTIDGFVCPSNRRATTVGTTRRDRAPTGAPSQLGPSDYRGNMAAGIHHRHQAPTAPNLTPDANHPIRRTPCACMYDNGVMYQNSTVNMADITDGTSTTIMFGESI